jgi:hypothetical protein
MEAAALSEIAVQKLSGPEKKAFDATSGHEAGVEKTYGKLHGAHRHRRNRPCTYPNWRLSAHVHLISMPIAVL